MSPDRIRELLDTPNKSLSEDDRMDIDAHWNVRADPTLGPELMNSGLKFKFHVMRLQHPETAKVNIQVWS